MVHVRDNRIERIALVSIQRRRDRDVEVVQHCLISTLVVSNTCFVRINMDSHELAFRFLDDFVSSHGKIDCSAVVNHRPIDIGCNRTFELIESPR
jgi:hypothetical protein